MTRIGILLILASCVISAGQVTRADLIYDFTSGDSNGFMSSGTGTTNWTYTGTRWETSEEHMTDAFLTSELLRATSGTVNLTLTHAYNFEDPYDFFDGGVLELSTNGGAFNVVTPTGGYPMAVGVMDGVDALGFIPGWGGNSGGSVVDTFALAGNSGDELRFRFHSAWDGSILTTSPNWSLSSFSVENVVAVPEPSLAILIFCCCGAGIVIVPRIWQDIVSVR